MKDSTILFSDEKNIFECKPQKAFFFYQFTMSFLYIFGVLCLIGFMLIGRFIEFYHYQLEGIVSPFNLLIGFCIVIIVASYIKSKISIPKMKYVLTNQRCIIYTGFIGNNKNIIPYNRIADVNLRQNTFEAIFGIVTVIINEQVGLGRLTNLNGLSMNDADEMLRIISQHITKK